MQATRLILMKKGTTPLHPYLLSYAPNDLSLPTGELITLPVPLLGAIYLPIKPFIYFNFWLYLTFHIKINSTPLLIFSNLCVEHSPPFSLVFISKVCLRGPPLWSQRPGAFYSIPYRKTPPPYLHEHFKVHFSKFIVPRDSKPTG